MIPLVVDPSTDQAQAYNGRWWEAHMGADAEHDNVRSVKARAEDGQRGPNGASKRVQSSMVSAVVKSGRQH